MKLGVNLRLMGASSAVETLLACARCAEDEGLDELWFPDHVAIPPDDAEGSDGRYLEIFTAISHLAAETRRIGLGTGVLVLPYREALATARQVATLQELSGGRLRLGVGVGWMDAEFRALGLDRSRRGALADAVLDLLRRCFDAPDDVVERNGQRFLFRPHPARPPIFVGGGAPHALARATRFGDGWMPLGAKPADLAEPIADLRRRFAAADKGEPEVVVLGTLPVGDPERAAGLLRDYRSIGVTRYAHAFRYDTPAAFRDGLAPLLRARDALASGATQGS